MYTIASGLHAWVAVTFVIVVDYFLFISKIETLADSLPAGSRLLPPLVPLLFVMRNSSSALLIFYLFSPTPLDSAATNSCFNAAAAAAYIRRASAIGPAEIGWIHNVDGCHDKGHIGSLCMRFFFFFHLKFAPKRRRRYAPTQQVCASFYRPAPRPSHPGVSCKLKAYILSRLCFSVLHILWGIVINSNWERESFFCFH